MYMASELYHGEEYDAMADQYFLGIVLYRLLNRNREPFVDAPVKMAYYRDLENAFQKRMKGATIPPPAEASEMLGRIVCRACAFERNDRYPGITAMKQDCKTGSNP